MPRLVLLLALASLFISGSALAIEPVSAIRQADYHFARGEYLETIQDLRDALVGVWNQAPLALTNVIWIKEAPEGYGMYTPRENNVLNDAEPILLYMEPVGYTIKKSGSYYSLSLYADFAVINSKGETIGGMEKFADWKVSSRSAQTEYPIF
ncbi:MAG: hypothetical protein JRD68_07965, partial [Deltaproteobacteria bacterium]|nr:hypothetical protein [Deltaproteobacteria bacterium]